MSAYVIVNGTILDQEKYNEYLAAGGGTLAQYGGKILVAGADSKVFEGNPGPLTAVVEFESMEAAQRWYDSPEYTEARKLRQRPGVSEGWLIIAPQYEMP